MSSKTLRIILVATLTLALFGACKGEKAAESDPFSFVVYPNSRYLGQLTDMTKAAHRIIDPNGVVPATAAYDTEAPVEEVARFYANEYGYELAPEPPVTLTNKPKAYFRNGDLNADVKGIEELLKKLNLNTDISKAVGTYRAAEIEAKANRPRVTVQRPYFDVTKSEVVDRTYILMSR